MSLIIRLLILILCLPAAGHGQRTLIRDVEPAAVIIYPADCSDIILHAAYELREYLQKVTGTALSLKPDTQMLPERVQYHTGFFFEWGEASRWTMDEQDPTWILVGRTKYTPDIPEVEKLTSEPGDAILMKTDGNKLLLLGSNERSTLYSVYAFLEEVVGCRWVMPGEIGDVIPRTKTLVVQDLNSYQVPDFPIRTSNHAFHQWRNNRDWSRKNRMNVTAGDPRLPERIPFGRYGTLTHNYYNFLSPDVYWKDHPEYFALTKGSRKTRTRYEASPNPFSQPCTSNPEVIAVSVTAIRRDLQENGPFDVYSLCPEDNMNFCSGDRCRIQDSGAMFHWRSESRNRPVVTDRVILYANRIAAQFPDETFYVFAYHNYMDPPKNVTPRSNVMIGITHMDPACYAHALNDIRCPKNTAFDALLKKWTAVHDNFMYYAYTAKTMWEQMPFPVAYRLGRDIQHLYAIGIRNFYSQGGLGRWGQLGPHFYTMAKLTWNVHQNVEDVVKNYFRSAFGSASDHMLLYYNLLAESLNEPHVHIHHQADKEARLFCTPGVMSKCERYLNDALAAAGNDRVRDRIMGMVVAHEYAERYFAAVELGFEYDRTKDVKILRQCVQMYEELIRYVKDHAVYNGVLYYGSEYEVMSSIENRKGRHYQLRKHQLKELENQ